MSIGRNQLSYLKNAGATENERNNETRPTRIRQPKQQAQTASPNSKPVVANAAKRSRPTPAA